MDIDEKDKNVLEKAGKVAGSAGLANRANKAHDVKAAVAKTIGGRV